VREVPKNPRKLAISEKSPLPPAVYVPNLQCLKKGLVYWVETFWRDGSGQWDFKFVVYEDITGRGLKKSFFFLIFLDLFAILAPGGLFPRYSNKFNQNRLPLGERMRSKSSLVTMEFQISCLWRYYWEGAQKKFFLDLPRPLCNISSWGTFSTVQ